MKALSVRQPWASLIANGAKTIEVRSRPTRHRGPLLICSSKRPADCGPAGVALCVVDVVDCRPHVPGDEVRSGVFAYEGYFAWVLGDVRPVEPFPVRGRIGLYSVVLPGDPGARA